MFAQTVELKSGTHGTSLRVAHESSPVTAMFSPQSFRYENLDRLANDFLAQIPEKLFGLQIDENNPALLIDEDDSVWS